MLTIRELLASCYRFYQRVFTFNQFNRDQWVAQRAQEIHAGAKVLDAGAGIGRYRPLFAHCDYRTQDFALELGTIGRYTTLDYKSDITKIPVPESSFDVVICTEVLEHVPEPIEAIKEFSRILRSGGTLILTAPLCSLLHQEPYHFYGGYTPYWYQHFLSRNGFRVKEIQANGRFFSLFGQEARRFSALIDPRRLPRRLWLLFPIISAMWIITLPFNRVLFPVLGYCLDGLELETMGTCGYHVVAVRER